MDSFEERRRARRSWPIRVVSLGNEELVDRRDTSTADERLALVWTLTRGLWAFSGREIPSYRRGEMPGNLIRP